MSVGESGFSVYIYYKCAADELMEAASSSRSFVEAVKLKFGLSGQACKVMKRTDAAHSKAQATVMEVLEGFAQCLDRETTLDQLRALWVEECTSEVLKHIQRHVEVFEPVQSASGSLD